MSGHKYPKSFPKDHPSAAVKAAWLMLDKYKPGTIPDIVRFELAGQIAGALDQMDLIKHAVDSAMLLAEFLDTVPFEKLDQIARLVPGLPEKIVSVQIAMTRAKNGSGT